MKKGLFVASMAAALVTVVLAGTAIGSWGKRETSLLGTERGNWIHGSWEAQDDFMIHIDAEAGTFAEDVVYQVGKEGDAVVPFETICHYRRSGSIRLVAAEADTQEAYRKNGKELPEFTIILSIENSVLIEDIDNDWACSAFIERQNREAPLDYSIGIKRVGEDGFLDPWYGLEYKRKR